MFGVCRKMRIPHRNRNGETLQQQIRACLYCSLVAVLKRKNPHKEKKQRNPKFAAAQKALLAKNGPIDAKTAFFWLYSSWLSRKNLYG
jgi:hypothetical protein